MPNDNQGRAVAAEDVRGALTQEIAQFLAEAGRNGDWAPQKWALCENQAMVTAEVLAPWLAPKFATLRAETDRQRRRGDLLRGERDQYMPDMARLEWMIAHRARVVSTEWRADRAVDDQAVTVEWDRCGHARNRVTMRPNARAAIDAAMNGNIDTIDDSENDPA
jgi:hypothetical protein